MSLTQTQREFWQATSFQFPSETNPRALTYRIAAFESAFPGVRAPIVPENASGEVVRAPEAAQSELRTITLVIRGEILSLNHLYPTNRKTGRRFKSKKGIAFKARAATALARQLQRIAYVRPSGDSFWHLEIMLFTDCFYQNGNVRKMDASNRIKVLEDSISDALGIDDKFFWSVHIEKRHSKANPRAVVILQQLDASEVIGDDV